MCLFTRAGDCLDIARLEIDATYQMVSRVGDVETVSGERETLRAIESRFVERAVNSAGIACADRLHECAVEFSNNDAIVI